MKKPKSSIAGIPVDFKCVKKIKDVELSIINFKNFNLFTLVLLNVFLIGTMIYYSTVFLNVVILLISIVAIVSCLTWSIMSHIKGQFLIKYTIYSNAIVKNSNGEITIGVLKDLRGYKVKRSYLDRFGKNKTSTLILMFNNSWNPRISFPCIDEDVDRVVALINELVRQRKVEAKNNHIKSLRISLRAKKYTPKDQIITSTIVKVKKLKRISLHSFVV